jgi:hypothetical protein
MSEYMHGYIDALCYMVQRGKPAAVVSLQNRHVDEAIEVIHTSHQLKTLVEISCEGWVELWIFRYDHVLDVIQSLPQVPSNNYEHWLLGKLFGYGEEAIAEFINSNSNTHAKKLY